MTIMALDIGLKRVGVAISFNKNIVTPLKAIIRKNRSQASSEVKNILIEWDIEKLVVGIPIDSSNSDEMKRRFEHFVNLIGFGGEVVYQDETMSSFEAKELMRGEIKEKKDGRIDSLSAKIVLERYLETI